MNQPDQLAHTLRTRHIVMIALGGVIGAGYFIGCSAALSMGGPAVMLSYVLAGTLVFLVNLMMRELAMCVPGRASFLGQIHFALGDRAAFVAGWAYWLTWVIVIAVEAIAVATMLAPYLPVPYAVVELGLLALMTGVNLLSVKGYGEFEYWFSGIKVLAIICFIGIGVWALMTHPVPVRQNLFGHGGLLPHGWMALLAVIPTVLFSMGGSEISTVAAVESDNTEQNIVRATRSIALRIGGFYLVSVALVLCLVPWSDVRTGYSPFLLVLNRLGVPLADTALALVVVTAALSSLNSGIYVTSRILFELAESGSAPAALLQVHARTKLPYRAIIASVLCGVGVAAFAVISPTLVFGLLVSLTGGFMVFNNAMIVAARMKLIREGLWKPCAAMLLIVATLVAMMIEPRTRSQILLGAAALVIICIGERFVPRRTRN